MPHLDRTLRRILARYPAERLAEDPWTARAALKDLLPDDPLAVSILTAVVEHGGLAALNHDDGVPLALLGPRLAEELARSSGIDLQRARWGVAAWAEAIGHPIAPPGPLPHDESRAATAGAFEAATEEPVDTVGETLARTLTLEAETRVVDAEGSVTEASATKASAAGPTAPLPAATDETATVIRPQAEETVIRPPVQSVDDRVDSPSTAPVADATSAEADRPADATGDAAPPARPGAPKTRGARRPVRRRRLVLVLAGVVVLALGATAAIVAVTARPTPLHVAGSASGATSSSSGRASALHDGTTLASGDRITVDRSTLQLESGSSVLRLAPGSTARVDGERAITLLTGRAFVAASGPALTVASAAGTASVHGGRALVGCTDSSTCTVTAIDEGTSVRKDGRTRALGRTATLASTGEQGHVLADAVRVDPWFKDNDARDEAQHRTPVGVTGTALLGDWTMRMSRRDLPVQQARPFTVGPGPCSALGCSIVATTIRADNPARDPVTGTVVALSGDGRRIAVDYGSHRARCRYLKNTPPGGGLDGTETVSDELTVGGSGASTSLSGTRTTHYIPTNANCATAAFTDAKVATLSASKGGLRADDFSVDDQQLLLNFVLTAGAGCVPAHTAPETDELSGDVSCSYATPGVPDSVEFASFSSSDALGRAFDAVGTPYAAPPVSTCSTGPCKGAAPNHNGKMLLTKAGSGAVLITFDPRFARLLVIAKGSSMTALRQWWDREQAKPQTYQAQPIPRVGV